jgi:hypothetical protein
MHRISLSYLIRDRILSQTRTFSQEGIVNLEYFNPTGINEALKERILELGAKQPQNLHRYIYALNNPVNLIDPYGFVSWWARLKAALKAMIDAILPVPVIGPTEVAEELYKTVPAVIEYRYWEYEEYIEMGLEEPPNPYEKAYKKLHGGK